MSPCNEHPVKLNFYRENWVSQRYTLFFLCLLKNTDFGYSLEPPHRGGSNEYPQSMFVPKSLEKYAIPMNYCIILYR